MTSEAINEFKQMTGAEERRAKEMGKVAGEKLFQESHSLFDVDKEHLETRGGKNLYVKNMVEGFLTHLLDENPTSEKVLSLEFSHPATEVVVVPDSLKNNNGLIDRLNALTVLYPDKTENA